MVFMNNDLKFFTISAIALALTACGQSEAKKAVQSMLNPENAAKFKDVKPQSKGKRSSCGFVSAKTMLGVYTSYLPFIYSISKDKEENVYILEPNMSERDQEGFVNAWNDICELNSKLEYVKQPTFYDRRLDELEEQYSFKIKNGLHKGSRYSSEKISFCATIGAALVGAQQITSQQQFDKWKKREKEHNC